MTNPQQTAGSQIAAPSGQLGADPDLEAWRRESDYWLKRLERSDDSAAWLLTACLTVGVVGAAAAGYVQARADDYLIHVKVALGLLIFAGVLTLAVRMWSSPVTRHLTRPKLKKHQGPGDAAGGQSLCDIERANARTHMKLAEARERSIGVALIAFAVGVVLIAWAGYEALSAQDPPKKQPTTYQPDSVPPARGAV